jgi:uncharacterized protein
VLRLRTPGLRQIVVVIISVIALQVVLQGFLSLQNFVWTHYLIPKSIQPYFDKLQHFIDGMYDKLLLMRSPKEFAFVLFVGAVVPAFCEEALFRGVVQYSFEQGMRKRWAFLLSASLFSMFHMNPMNFLVIFFLGFYLSFLVWRSGSLYLSMIAHFTNNAFGIWLMYSFKKDDIMQTQSGEPVATAIIAATGAGILVTGACVWYFMQITKQRVTQISTL